MFSLISGKKAGEIVSCRLTDGTMRCNVVIFIEFDLACAHHACLPRAESLRLPAREEGQVCALCL